MVRRSDPTQSPVVVVEKRFLGCTKTLLCRVSYLAVKHTKLLVTIFVSSSFLWS